ncbi:response regulator [Azospirillum sp. RWY-5-1]|uniref:Response regulator n=1 Tax=Azospirillum oleiclasticum TaxID=2735135 RepID=A0ABX2TC93_9PROT|nr:response regulator [Azospirillum oleiclasticum]NYZ15164.1 response regulator [Azospirillum oleiclasticum]NYZ21415.1 response regulator [Azospirillum oleiclasticum]
MNAAPHILVVDDHAEIRDLLGRFLRQHGFRATGVPDGQGMRAALASATVDLVVLDLMLPGESGLDLCRELRGSSSLPVIMLTAMGEETDRIVGLEVGADDYVPKPFNARELLARIRAVLRRTADRPAAGPQGNALVFAGWRLDLVRRDLTSPDGVAVDLTSGEYDLLLAFAENPQTVLSRDRLLELSHNRVFTAYDRSIDVQVSRLRRKIEDESRPDPLIKTIRGVGYMLTVPVGRP